jgi:hypothetical protein
MSSKQLAGAAGGISTPNYLECCRSAKSHLPLQDTAASAMTNKTNQGNRLHTALTLMTARTSSLPYRSASTLADSSCRSRLPLLLDLISAACATGTSLLEAETWTRCLQHINAQEGQIHTVLLQQA